MRYTTRPLSNRAWMRPPVERRPSQFKITWTQAQDALHRELVKIDGRDLVIEIDVREQDLRLDGMLRANARPDQPAVIVAFESAHGPLLYRSDQYAGSTWSTRMEAWQHNVYAVALTLEALRAVDRYGAARSGEQYRGYRQIGNGSIATDAPLTPSAAADILRRAAHPAGDAPAVVRFDTTLVRRAQRNTHPDTRHELVMVTFDEVQRAAAAMGVTS